MTEELGKGGMGTVCRALDEVLGREVAIKELRAFTDAAGPELRLLRGRMQREARAAARIRHPGVVAVHDVTEHEGRPVIVMELVDGPSLADLLQDEGELEPRAAAAVGAKVADALAAAHRAGVLHRDIKPGNILLDRDDRVFLTDFGIATMDAPGEGDPARLTESGVLVGSLEYLAPERARGHEPGPPSDIWSLGATLYAAVEGASPFHRTSTWATLTAILSEPLPPPRRCGPLTAVLLRLMDKDPQARPDAVQACELLQAVASGRESGGPTLGLRLAACDEVPAGPPSVAQPPEADIQESERPVALATPAPVAALKRATRRRRTAVAVTAAGGVLMVAGTTVAFLGQGSVSGPVATERRAPGLPSAPGSGAGYRAGSAAQTVGDPTAPAGATAAGSPHHASPSAADPGPTGTTVGAAPGTGTGEGDGAGAGATETATATATATTAPASACSDAGDGRYVCVVMHPANSYDDAGHKVGRVAGGSRPFYCQSDLGRSQTDGTVTSSWWARTDDDRGNSGVWISDVHIEGSTNDQPLPGLPTC